jgi:hypothetical protein
MKHVIIASIVLALMVPLVTTGVAAKNDNALIKSSKKPGKTCDTLAPGSSAHKDCIQSQAHIGQTDKGKGKGQSKKP